MRLSPQVEHQAHDTAAGGRRYFDLMAGYMEVCTPSDPSQGIKRATRARAVEVWCAALAVVSGSRGLSEPQVMQPGKVSPEPLWLVAASPKDTLSDTEDEAGRVLEDQLANGVQIASSDFLTFLRHLVCISREFL